MEYIFLEVRLDALDEHVAGLADAAADDHHFRVDHAAYVAKEHTHIIIDLIQNGRSGGIPGLGCIENILAGHVFNGAQRGGGVTGVKIVFAQTDNAGGRAVLLNTAVLTAVAGDGFVGVYYQVADFRAGAMSAMEKLALYHNAAAHTGAQGDEHHVLAALAAAFPELAQSGYVGIVACLHRKTGALGQSLGNVEYPPAQVDAFVDHALGVYRAGNTDAQTQNGRICNAVAGHILADGVRDIR